jgi:hypothetical protein
MAALSILPDSRGGLIHRAKGITWMAVPAAHQRVELPLQAIQPPLVQGSPTPGEVPTFPGKRKDSPQATAPYRVRH